MAKNSTRPTNPEKAFRKGLSELRGKDLPAAREALYRILRVTTPQGFRNYANGKVQNLDVDKARQIEALFSSYGVANPWGL
jgi:hypothetical protein